MKNELNISKRDVAKQYNLPNEIKFCTKCTISNQRPRISFNKQGICSACEFSEYKKSVEWDKREQELLELLDKHRRNDGSFDVVVPVSGGKDGSFVAHQLKERYGMNPLTVTWAPHISTDIGSRNLESFIDSGFVNVYGKANGKIHRLLTKLSFIHLGDPFQPFIYGQTNFPLKVAVQNNISLIMYGENGEVEYGGDMKNATKPTREVTDHEEHYFSGIAPEVWQEYGISKKEIFPYLPPSNKSVKDNNTEIHFFSYYRFWDPQENFYYCREQTGFQPNTERTEGTYSKYASLDDKLDGLHYYLAYIKFGIGRTTSDTAHEIRDGKITRDEGIALIRKYDGEFPKKYFQEFLDYTGLTEEHVIEVLDSWRSDHIWKKIGNKWHLKHSIFSDTELQTKKIA